MAITPSTPITAFPIQTADIQVNKEDILLSLQAASQANLISVQTNAANDATAKANDAKQDAVDESLSYLNSHASNFNNPHAVTKAQVGLGNVDNTSDATKALAGNPIGNAIIAASPSRVTFSKANFTIPSTASYVAQIGAFTPGTDAGGERVVTLPNATTYGVGKMITIADESNSLRPWYRLMVAPATGQSLNGVVNGTYPMVWARQTSSFVCTGTGWQILACNIVPTLNVSENPNHGRGNVCVEADFGEFTSGSNSSSFRLIGTGAALVATGNNATNFRTLAIAAAAGSGNGARMVTTPTQDVETLSRLSGYWCEWHVASIEAGDATNNSVQEFGITSYNIGTPVADALHGVVLRYERAVNANNWIAVSSNNGTRTVVDTGIAYSSVGANAFRVGIQMGTSQCHVFLNDTLAGVLNTNIPPGTSSIAPSTLTRWVSGVNRNIFVDRLRYQFQIADVANRLY